MGCAGSKHLVTPEANVIEIGTKNVGTPKTGGQIIHEILKRYDVKHVFGYSGGQVLPVIDPFYNDPSIKWVTSAREQCAGHAAAGSAKATGRPGVCIVTSGPGLTNLVTPVQDAYTDGVPMVVLSGQVPTSAIGTDAFQECPATEILRPCTKWTHMVKDFKELPHAIHEAFRICMSGRPGPVHIDLPKDVTSQTGLVSETALEKPEKNKLENKNVDLDTHAIQRAATMINKAKRPIFIVGQGAINDGAWQAVRRLVKLCQIPVATAVHGMGFKNFSTKF